MSKDIDMKLVFFLFFLFLLLFLSLRKEGFNIGIPNVTVGKYDYLKPPPGPAVLSEEVEKNFLEVYNQNAAITYPTGALDKDKLNGIKPYFTVEEVDYYVKNKKWPYGEAIKYCLEQKKEVIKGFPVKTVEDIQKFWPTRLVFMVLCNGECAQASPSLECDIFSGKHKESKEESEKKLF